MKPGNVEKRLIFPNLSVWFNILLPFFFFFFFFFCRLNTSAKRENRSDTKDNKMFILKEVLWSLIKMPAVLTLNFEESTKTKNRKQFSSLKHPRRPRDK